MAQRHFISDNASGIHPQVLQAIAAANTGHQPAYGQDDMTIRAEDLFRRHFGADTICFFTLTGTAANIIALQSVVHSFEAIICADCAHLHRDECGAPEKFMGCKLLTAATDNGKITPATITPLLRDTHIIHRAQPKVVSLAQCTEWGTVYTPEELKTLSDFCHEHRLLLHMDGARLSNAAAALELSLKEITTDCGVDMLSFGGSKNGLMNAEAVLFFDPELATHTAFYRKQAMQLAAKMRFIAAQFVALLDGDLWRDNAAHANQMARLLAKEIGNDVEIVMPVTTNAIFARIPADCVEPLQQHYQFSLWNSHESIVRWMTSFDTSEHDVRTFAESIREQMNSLTASH
ncbi:low specificity L-threonine aldolase [Methylomarinum sp. Ch1-1]|uniref:Low specificity L-threonine aldolase n=1 Tax=Methylomarinum roseum TaxID=3067653 RepID=A0AAU7NR15_9GAMM|nr:low specificity L-threonine aldolase [Methylomarinum sp. Ch1-1]MDP4520982.1 low specificity L-threonine aldolase [Methylomarinum sp. Ch1-1]